VTGAQLCQLHMHHQRHLQQYGYDPCAKGINNGVILKLDKCIELFNLKMLLLLL